MYEIVEVSLANTRALYEYKLKKSVWLDRFSLKRFEYAWIINSHSFQTGEKVLDVGASYSPLPGYIQQTYGCETWALDDFGLIADEPHWHRHMSPDKHIKKNLEVKFVLERLGNYDESSLPNQYFDLIYSSSTLEHIPPPYSHQFGNTWISCSDREEECFMPLIWDLLLTEAMNM